ncbi:hypothetical protein AYO20_10623 [Fonsecaea nubica]|uniref:Putative peptidase domain-containing protein n=1 Tax=Fonsecaea nubica TaxID=856822 RepID=A0A178C5U9_9EURO|nr:hypothetical protein AYO20_10623 [Fonsecaea nubica]OAL24465.1 hypothetical protein AYO20_10623 [Fonsecaea nubica]
MSLVFKALFVSAIAGVLAAPTQLVARQEAPPSEIKAWDAGAVSEFQIHESCNVTQATQIAAGLDETILLVEHAKEHVLRFGNTSDIYRRYFGDRPPHEVIGAYEIIIHGDKKRVLFRCDNPDGNCDIPTYAGHWRGENGTDETVICDLSYQTRRWLSSMCALGYTVADSPTNTFWASDLLHRLYHVPVIGWGHIEHFADDYEEVVELAAGDTPESTHDSDTLQYFALEVYAFDIAVPGVGCLGGEGSGAAPPPPATTSSPTTPEAPSSTAPPQECHTHEGGDVHCS